MNGYEMTQTTGQHAGAFFYYTLLSKPRLYVLSHSAIL